ncbi:diacylglycerol/lipid kinase family protein [Pseudokineococcus sp. 1T1Z-3]|uniref:diacylglycerol/lipid kinase family protein n=1 Tax=Pseudokineococcus sp. 1T1Z-3 TaxID=3132745 RepID=UPI00309DEFDA
MLLGATISYGTGRLPLDSVAMGVVLLVVLLAVLVLSVLLSPRGRPAIPSIRRDAAAGLRAPDEDYRHVPGQLAPVAPRAVVIVQPVKYPDGSPARKAVLKALADAGWPKPLWVETTEEDPGYGHARAVAELDPELVLVLGGDGTVRSVGAGLAGTGVPLGLLPGGTGNLFARQLKLELGDVGRATRDALHGKDKRVDVGRVSLDGGQEQVFLVMAGIGFDAQMISGAPAAIKDRVGPLAYVVSGVRRLRGESLEVSISVDGGEPTSLRTRMAVVGNTGTLLGGIVLIPQAEVDDGHLDVMTLSPNGLADWLRVGVSLLTGRRTKDRQITESRGTEIVLRCSEPQVAQMDGDIIGTARELTMRVDPGVLVLRLPEGRVPRAAERLADALRGR